MKKMWILSGLLFFFSQFSFSQNNYNDMPEAVAQRQTEQMKHDLNLSGEQTKMVADINMKYATQMEQLRTSGLSQDVIQNQMYKIKNARMTELKAVLDKKQFRTYKSTQLEQRQQNPNGKGKGKGNGSGGGGHKNGGNGGGNW